MSDNQEIKSSLTIRDTYTKQYYLTDCGGYDAFHKTKGRKLADLRLQTMSLIAATDNSCKVLDAGCGRGELAYHFASLECDVTAIDYSPAAIALAQQCFEGEEEKAQRVTFLCENVCTVTFSEQFDLITASDLIEHLSPTELDLFYENCARHLPSQGRLIIHTFPNLWFYKYDYSRKRALAARSGYSLPEQPRTEYELLMHINEQSPRVLLRQLRKYFPHVILWFGSEADPGGSLARRFSIQELRSARSLFAVASHSPIDVDSLKKKLTSEPFPPLAKDEISIEPVKFPENVSAASEFQAQVTVRNQSAILLKTMLPYPVCLSYHWLGNAGNIIIREGMRTALLPFLRAGEEAEYEMTIKAPEQEGHYILRLTILQEGVRWFDTHPTDCYSDVSIKVSSGSFFSGKNEIRMESLTANTFLKAEDRYRTTDEIKQWIGNTQAWPTADSYNPDTLSPCPVLASREAALREQVPEWFWSGEQGASILSVGTGKGYFERKYWGNFDAIHIIDPSESTHQSCKVFPIRNLATSHKSLFDASAHFDLPPRYGWLGASSHYAFGEFYGWRFMQKLAMMISDTLVIDGGVFDAGSQQGKYLLGKWREEEISGDEPFETHRASQFTYKSFLSSIEPFWQVISEIRTPWITDGRHTLVLKRKLPSIIQRKQLGDLNLLYNRQDKPRDNWKIYRCSSGYYKETPHIGSLLIYDTVSKVFGWSNMILHAVYEGDQYAGFIVKDYGDQEPASYEVSEKMFIKVLNWSLPLGLLPADVARGNIRIFQNQPVWIDIMLLGLHEYNAFLGAWSVNCTYKNYDSHPDYIPEALRHLNRPGFL